MQAALCELPRVLVIERPTGGLEGLGGGGEYHSFSGFELRTDLGEEGAGWEEREGGGVGKGGDRGGDRKGDRGDRGGRQRVRVRCACA